MVKKEKTLLILMTLGLSLMLILRDLAGIEMSKFILFGYTVACMAIVKYNTLVYFLCFIMPLMCGLPGTYIMPCALVLLVLKKGSLDLKRFLMILAILIMEVVASFWYPTLELKSIVQYVSFAGVMIYLSHDRTVLDYKLCLQMFLLGVTLLNGVIVISGLITAPSDWLRRFANGWFRFGSTHVDANAGMTLNLNANSMGYYSVVGMCCGILLAEKSAKNNRFWTLLFTAFGVVSGFLTVSLTWLLVATGCIGLYVMSKIKSPRQVLAMSITMCLLIVVGVVVLSSNPQLLVSFVTRLNSDNVADANGRVAIFMRYMDVFTSNWRYFLLGTGVTQRLTVLDIHRAFHNGTQQILVCCGLIGFIIYMFILISAVVKARNHRKLPMIYWLPLISVVVFVQAIQFLNPMMLMLPYSIGIYSIKLGCTNS